MKDVQQLVQQTQPQSSTPARAEERTDILACPAHKPAHQEQPTSSATLPPLTAPLVMSSENINALYETALQKGAVVNEAKPQPETKGVYVYTATYVVIKHPRRFCVRCKAHDTHRPLLGVPAA